MKFLFRKLRAYAGYPFMVLTLLTLRLFKPKMFTRWERVALFFRRCAYRVAGKELPPITVTRYLFGCEGCKKVYVCGSDFITDIGAVCNVCGKVEREYVKEVIELK